MGTSAEAPGVCRCFVLDRLIVFVDKPVVRIRTVGEVVFRRKPLANDLASEGSVSRKYASDDAGDRESSRSISIRS